MLIEPDHYGILELEPGSPIEEVKSQYRRLAKRYHPDLHGNDARSAEQFRRVNAAYAFLSDAPRKAAYDAVLQAARKVGAPPLKAPPSSTTTGYHAPVTATGYHARAPRDVRMTRSAWLGATAGAVVVLLVIGLSLDGSGPGRPGTVRGKPLALKHAPLKALGDGARPADGTEPGADAEPMPDPLFAPAPSDDFSVPTVGAAPLHSSPLHSSPLHSSRPPSRVPTVFASRAEAAPPAANPAMTLNNRQQARYQAALPRADRLINQRDFAYAANAEKGSRRSQQGQAALRHLGKARQRVRDDLKAISFPAFRFPSSAPAQAAPSVPAAPVTPESSAARVVPEAPKPPDNKPPNKLADKPKAPASSGQEFIMWGK